MIAPIDLTGAESTRTLHRRWQERASVGSGAGAPRESSAQAVQPVVSAPMLILALIVLGMGIGWVAQLIMGRGTSQIDWTMALVAGTLGSFVGGLLFSLLAGDGLAVKPSGVDRVADRRIDRDRSVAGGRQEAACRCPSR